MTEGGNRTRIAFLLGAGASVDAGYPTAVGLTNKLDDWVSENRIELLHALRFVTGALQFGRSCRGESLSADTNIEDILSACSFLTTRSRSFAYPFVGAWHERLAALERVFSESSTGANPFDALSTVAKQRLRDWLWIESSDVARVKYLWSFQDFLNDGFALDIFTLNYDATVEVALETSRGQINGDWTTGFGDRGWDPLLLEIDRPVRLFKLHGSLDWVRDERLGLCSLRWPPAIDSEEIPESVDSLLIFGTDAKLQAVDPFLTLLYRFRQSVFESAAVVIIGYSFGDQHVNDILWEAMQREATKRCIVVNSSPILDRLSVDPRLGRLADVENRFRQVQATAREAFEKNLALAELKRVLAEQASEEPF